MRLSCVLSGLLLLLVACTGDDFASVPEGAAGGSAGAGNGGGPGTGGGTSGEPGAAGQSPGGGQGGAGESGTSGYSGMATGGVAGSSGQAGEGTAGGAAGQQAGGSGGDAGGGGGQNTAGACAAPPPCAGACNEVTVVSDVDLPQELVVDDKDVYWTDLTGRVWRAKLQAKASPEEVAAPDPSAAIAGLSIEGNSLYWANNNNSGTVWRNQKTPGQTTKIAAGQSSPRYPVSDGTSVFWGTKLMSGELQVLSCVIATCPASTAKVFSPKSLEPSALYPLPDGADLFVAVVASAGGIWKVPLDQSSSPSPLFSINLLRSMVADDTALYWMTAGGAISRGEKTGGTPTLLAQSSSPGFDRNIAIDPGSCPGRRVYWADSLQGEVLACSVEGCQEVPSVVSKTQTPVRVAVNQSKIAWISKTSDTKGSILVRDR